MPQTLNSVDIGFIANRSTIPEKKASGRKRAAKKMCNRVDFLLFGSAGDVHFGFIGVTF
jgi:hypothetical protein